MSVYRVSMMVQEERSRPRLTSQAREARCLSSSRQLQDRVYTSTLCRVPPEARTRASLLTHPRRGLLVLSMLWCVVLRGLWLLRRWLLLRRWWCGHCAGGETVGHRAVVIPLLYHCS